jgi:hypothetical protein
MSFLIEVMKGVRFSETPGTSGGFDGVRVRQKSEKHPYHPFFEIGYFKSPHVDFSAALRQAIREMVDNIFNLTMWQGRFDEPIPVHWSEAKHLVRAVLIDFDTFSVSAFSPAENDYYRQALEIIEETIDLVLKAGNQAREYYLRCYGLDGPALAPK